ncbi:MAG: hypothetical protein R3267_05225 [Paenisporosarcina sp.]|nr:hypothetical protein [Paenisporosarcina sp.]
MANKKPIVYISLGVLFLLIAMFILLFGDENVEYTEESFVQPESVVTIETEVTNSKKMHEFILAKIPNSDRFLKIHAEESEDGSIEEHYKATMELFYSSIKQNEIDYFTSVMDLEVVQSLWGSTMNFQEREQILKDALKTLDREGKLSALSYQLEKEEYEVVGSKGVITLSYSDGIEIKYPFAFKEIGEDDHHEFTLDIELSNLLEKIKNTND